MKPCKERIQDRWLIRSSPSSRPSDLAAPGLKQGSPLPILLHLLLRAISPHPFSSMDAVLQPPVGRSISGSRVSAARSHVDLVCRRVLFASETDEAAVAIHQGEGDHELWPSGMLHRASRFSVDRVLDPQVCFKSTGREGAAWHFVERMVSTWWCSIRVFFGARSVLSWPWTLGMKGRIKVKVDVLLAHKQDDVFIAEAK